MRVLLSTSYCDPTKGYEPNNGWSWALHLSRRGFEACITGKKGIEDFAGSKKIYFHYIELPNNLDKLYSKSMMGMYLWQWYAHDVFFFTSLRDSGGVQLIEAMACGLPIIILNLHGQAVIVNDDTGIRCNCTTPEETVSELKNAILKLYNNPSLVKNMGEKAFLFAQKQTWENKVKDIVNNYYPKNHEKSFSHFIIYL